MLLDELYQAVHDGRWPTADPVRECETLARATVVRISNVVQYLWAISDRRDWDVMADMPTPLAPWPVAWLEWRVPQHLRIDGRLVPSVEAGLSIGVLVETRASGEGYTALLTGFLKDRLARFALVYDKSGALTYCPTDTEIAQANPDFIVELVRQGCGLEDIGAGLRYMFLLPALLTFTFANCRNISMLADTFNTGLQRKRRERGKVPVDRVYVLQIKAIDTLLRSTGGLGSGTTLPQALHISRAHFKRYTDDHKLSASTWARGGGA